MKNLRHVLCWGVVLGTVVCSGCRIRDYMVPWIIDGELEKMAGERAHRCVNVAQVLRGDVTREVQYTVDFSPPDRLRQDFQAPLDAAGLVLCVTTESYLIYSPKLNQAERILGLPPFSKDTFREYRKVALLNGLAQNKVYAEDASENPGKFWEVRTIPKNRSLWPFETVSYISKETKNNLRAFERDKSGKIINQFETQSKSYEVNFSPEHFRIPLPENCSIVEYNLVSLPALHGTGRNRPKNVPLEFEGLRLARAKETAEQRIYDYTSRQKVFFYALQWHGDQPLLESPLSREIDLAGNPAYLNYAGTYVTCRWRSDGWDHLVFTNLGPDMALDFARRVALKVTPASSKPVESAQVTAAEPQPGSGETP